MQRVIRRQALTQTGDKTHTHSLSPTELLRQTGHEQSVPSVLVLKLMQR